MSWFKRAPDRRVAPRFQADLPVVLSVVGDSEITSLRVLSDGISEGGLSVAGLQGLTVGDAVSLEVHLPEPIWVEAVVRYTRTRCGFQFVSPSPRQRQLIRHYCRFQPRQKSLD